MRTRLKYVLEGSEPNIEAIISDGVSPIPAATLKTLTLTYFNGIGEAVINTRDDQDVLNVNQVTVDVNGNLVWKMEAADTIIVDTTLRRGQDEIHVALFTWTWDDADVVERTGRYEVEIPVRQTKGP